MNKMITEPRDCRKSSRLARVKQFGLSLLLMTAGLNPVWAEQAVTGKIVIDGVIIEDGNTPIVRGSGLMGREQRSVDDFDSVLIDGSLNVHFRRGQNTRVEVSGDQNLLPLITTETRSGRLTISSTGSYQPQLPLTVELIGPHLKAVVAEGSGDNAFNDLDENELNLELNGSGQVLIDGKVKRLAISLNGSGDVDAKDLLSHSAELNITGSGNISVSAKQSLSVMITGSGDVNYYGHPGRFEKQVTGSGEVRAGD